MQKTIYTIRENDLTYGRGYGKDHERKYGKMAVSEKAGTEAEPVWRIFVEPILLCGNSQ